MELIIRLNPVAFSLAIPAIISGCLAVYSFMRRSVAGSHIFTFIMLAICVWSIAYGLELSCLTLDGMLLFSVLKYAAIAVVPVLWLILVLLYIGREKWVTRRNVILLFIIPLITIVMVAANQLHYLFYSSVSVDNSGQFPMIVVTRGPWFLVHSLYCYAVLFVATVLLIQRLGKPGSVFRYQVIAMLVGMSVPWIVNILYLVFRLAPFGRLDLTPFAFTVTGVVVAWAIYRHGLFDVMPTDYATILNSVDDVIVVLDGQNRIVEYNKAAGEMLELSHGNIGQSAAVVWKDRPDLLLAGRLDEKDHIEITLGKLDAKHYYEASTYDIADWHRRSHKKVISLHDITDTKKAQESLRLSEEKYRLVVENSQDIIYMVNTDGILTFVSPSWTSFFGHPVDQVVGTSLLTYVHPDDLARCITTFSEGLAADRKVMDFECRGCHIDGSWHWVIINAVPLIDANGTVIGMEGTCRDITERKRVEHELRESEGKYRTLVDKANEAVMIIQDGISVFANRKMSGLVGVPAGELEGKPFIDFIWPGDREFVTANYLKRIAGDDVIDEYDFRIIGAGGTMGWVFMSVAVVQWKGRQAILCLMTDITRRKQAEKALQQSEEKSRLLIENSHDIIYTITTDGVFTFVSPAWTAFLGHPVDQVVGKSLLTFIHPDDVEMCITALADGLKAGQPVKDFEYRVCHMDGTWRWHTTSAVPLTDEVGTIIGIEGISRDITERKQMEHKLEEMATHDFLTGLPNRVLLLDRFTIAAALAHRNKVRLAVMSLDLDKFKSVNDTLGHDAGDQVLKVVAARLTGIIRASDTVARVGGDEFVVLVFMETDQAADAIAVAQKILDSLTGPLFIDGHHLDISTSIGIAFYPEDGHDLKILVKKSDAAMYYSKAHGRNRFKFFSDGDVTFE